MSDDWGGLEARAQDIADAGLLTKRQAEAYLYREVDGASRKTTAERMRISPNVVDKHLRKARDRVDAAAETIEGIRAFQQQRIEQDDADE